MGKARISVAVLVAVIVAACGDDGPAGPGTIQAAGSYDTVFTTTEVSEGCGGVVPEGSTQRVLIVSEGEGQVTLNLSDLSEFILEDPSGDFDPRTGTFSFQGEVLVGDELNQLPSQGTIDGEFTAGGSVNLDFVFSLLECTVEGTIVGTRV